MPDIPGSESPAPQGPQADGCSAAGAASPVDPKPQPAEETRSSLPGPGSVPPDAAGHHRRPGRKIIRPAIFALTAVAFGLLAYALYPSRTQLPTPTYSTLHLYSKLPVDLVTYQVNQVTATTAEMKISVQLSPAVNPPAGLQASMNIFTPLGVAFYPCLNPLCQNDGNGNYEWQQPLTFTQVIGPGGLPDTTTPGMNAFAKVYVAARGFGVTSDGATASAALPKLLYTGPGSPALITQYNIPSANNYDWATFPPAFADGSKAQWLEQMSNDEIVDVDVAGTDHAIEDKDNDLTFLAGALVGVAGGALLSALQEALDFGD